MKRIILLLAFICLPAWAGESSFWTLTKGDKTIHLLGTIHLLPAEAYPLPAEIYSALQQSDRLYLELVEDMNAPDLSAYVLAAGYYQDGSSLPDHISAQLWADLSDYLAGRGIPASALASAKPWLLMSTMTVVEAMALGFNPELGLDIHIRAQALDYGIDLFGLETIKQQVDLLVMSTEDAEAVLRATLDELLDYPQQMQALYQAWQEGDADTLQQLMNASMAQYPKMEQILIHQRNQNWLEQLSFQPQQSEWFVAVGAGHLSGPKGLLSLLQQQGYQLQ